MRFVIYKNSVPATICSMLGAAFFALAVLALINGEIDILSGVITILISLGLMWLGGFISERKARCRRQRARQGAENAPSRPAAQAAPAYSTREERACPAPEKKAVKASAVLAGVFFLLAALLEAAAILIPCAELGQPLMLRSEEVMLAAMGILQAIAFFRTRHTQQASVLLLIGFLGLALGSADAALLAHRVYGAGSYATEEGIHYAMAAAPALKAAAYLVMAIFSLLAMRKFRDRCGGIVRWPWLVPILALLPACAKELSDNDALQGLLHSLSRSGGFPGLSHLVHSVLLHAYAVVLLAAAVLFSAVCLRRLCRKPAAAYAPAAKEAFPRRMEKSSGFQETAGAFFFVLPFPAAEGPLRLPVIPRQIRAHDPPGRYRPAPPGPCAAPDAFPDDSPSPRWK